MSTGTETEGWIACDGDEPEDVLFNSLYGLRSIELNRPCSLNALNGSMIRKIAPRLVEWGKSDMANVVVIKGAGDKAFCAGGDVITLAQWNKNGQGNKSVEFFALEYQLDHMIATFNKPYVAFMDGITMGGGAGLCMHAPFRIATERTVFSMPETTIGFFPDVGASFFLPRMNGSVGTYLALTSERLQAVDVFWSGIATHYLHSTSLPSLESRLAELRFRDYDRMEQRLAIVNAAIEEHATGLPYDQPMQIAGRIREAIDYCFSRDTIHHVVDALQSVAQVEADNPDKSVQEWATRTLTALRKRSPTSLHVTLRQMREGASSSLASVFRREHQLAARFMAHPDFVEGVRAQIVDSDYSPRWLHASLEDVPPNRDITSPFFQERPGSDEPPPLQLMSNEDMITYPLNLGLPTEEEVQEEVAAGTRSRDELVRYFMDKTRSKQGVREAVEEILSRKTVPKAGGKVEWKY